MKRLALTCAVFVLCGSAASAGPMDGEWCDEDWGMVLIWEERALQVGEHGMCDWGTAPGNVLSIKTQLSCQDIYMQDGEEVRTNPRETGFFAEMRANGTMEVQFDGMPKPVVLQRCQ